MTPLDCISTPDALHAWVKSHLHVSIPRVAICPHHRAPFDYLVTSFFEPSRDQLVWAPRGGGKTRLGAIATLLDLVHKPGCSVRILGGSLDQSLRMWEHLLPDLERLAGDMLEGKRAARRVLLSTGSCAAVLTQSQRAVRGLHVNKLRCDEVELFDPKVWEAAQLAVRTSRDTNNVIMAGAIEAVSTLHVPGGLMQRLVDSAAQTGKQVVRWCLMEVLEHCPDTRDCTTCPLWDDCAGIAKTRCDGFFSIDDAIAMKQRVSQETWDAEMLCRRPSVQGCVFPSFDLHLHVRDALDPSEIAPVRSSASGEADVHLALDFGFANPFVCLWIAEQGNVMHVIDEYVQSQQTIDAHVTEIQARPWKSHRIACDPAGSGRSDQTAKSNVDHLRSRGYVVKYRSSRIVEGIEAIRAALRPASGPPRLFIHPRCRHLIVALQSYRYPTGAGEIPLKDGRHDHLIDALRYHVVNRTPRGAHGGRTY